MPPACAARAAPPPAAVTAAVSQTTPAMVAILVVQRIRTSLSLRWRHVPTGILAAKRAASHGPHAITSVARAHRFADLRERVHRDRAGAGAAVAQHLARIARIRGQLRAP